MILPWPGRIVFFVTSMMVSSNRSCTGPSTDSTVTNMVAIRGLQPTIAIPSAPSDEGWVTPNPRMPRDSAIARAVSPLTSRPLLVFENRFAVLSSDDDEDTVGNPLPHHDQRQHPVSFPLGTTAHRNRHHRADAIPNWHAQRTLDLAELERISSQVCNHSMASKPKSTTRPNRPTKPKNPRLKHQRSEHQNRQALQSRLQTLLRPYANIWSRGLRLVAPVRHLTPPKCLVRRPIGSQLQSFGNHTVDSLHCRLECS
jgi:hypothetical protein